MFEPVNALETLMQSAASNPAKIPDFYRALLDSELYILTPETELEPDGDGRSNPTRRSASRPSSSRARHGIPRLPRRSGYPPI